MLVSCELRAVLSHFEKRASKDFSADNFAAAYGTWLHPRTQWWTLSMRLRQASMLRLRHSSQVWLHSLPGHPATEFAPARVLDAALECAVKEHLEVVTSRCNPNWFEADREALNKAIASRNACSSQLFKRPKDAAVKAEFARARQVRRKGRQAC